MSDEEPHITLGVIGCGRIAQAAHLPAIKKASGVRLVAVSDPSPILSKGVGAQYRVDSFTDTAALLDLDLDAVLIATPDRLHLPLGLAAIASGKHVLMEKPLASNSTEAQQLADAAANAGVKLQTGSMKRHDPGLEYARANIHRLGRILSMTTWYRVMSATRPAIQQTLFPSMIVDEAVRTAENAFKADGQRYRLATHGAHLFDGLRNFAGNLDWMSARSGTVAGDITWHGLAGMADSGGLASFDITTNVHSQWAEGNDIFGEFGHIKTRSPYGFLKAGSTAEVFIESEGIASVPHFGDTNPYKRQIEAFARAVLDGNPTNPSPQDAIWALRLIEAVAESCAAGGREVALR
jgi:predicted dehydrogenase